MGEEDDLTSMDQTPQAGDSTQDSDEEDDSLPRFTCTKSRSKRHSQRGLASGAKAVIPLHMASLNDLQQDIPSHLAVRIPPSHLRSGPYGIAAGPGCCEVKQEPNTPHLGLALGAASSASPLACLCPLEDDHIDAELKKILCGGSNVLTSPVGNTLRCVPSPLSTGGTASPWQTQVAAAGGLASTLLGDIADFRQPLLMYQQPDPMAATAHELQHEAGPSGKRQRHDYSLQPYQLPPQQQHYQQHHHHIKTEGEHSRFQCLDVVQPGGGRIAYDKQRRTLGTAGPDRALAGPRNNIGHHQQASFGSLEPPHHSYGLPGHLQLPHDLQGCNELENMHPIKVEPWDQGPNPMLGFNWRQGPETYSALHMPPAFPPVPLAQQQQQQWLKSVNTSTYRASLCGNLAQID